MEYRIKYRVMVLLSTIGCLASSASSGVIYVDLTALPAGDGLSWDSAFDTLKEGLGASVSGDEIWVKAGLYQPQLPTAGSNNAAYLLRDGVGIYGGFVGTETQRAQRDAATNITILSGLDSTQISHIFEGQAVGPTTVIDGFTIRDVISADDIFAGVGGAGGGMLLIGSSPTVVDCKIINNESRLGSGVYVQDGSPSFLRCLFESNRSARSGEGGAIYSLNTNLAVPQTLDVEGSEFNLNSVLQGHWATGNGGAIYTSSGVVLTVLGSSFTSNYGWHNNTFGNGVVGGAIAALGDGTYIENSSFITNYSNLGAGVYSAGDIQIVQSLFVANRAVGATTCGGFDCPTDVPDVFSGLGGGLYVNVFSVVDIDQCTFASNWAADSGGGVSANGTIDNSILWDNRSPQVCCGEDPLAMFRMQYQGTLDISYSSVEGLLTPPLGEDPPNPLDFPGCNENNPQFAVPTLISQDFGWLLSSIGDHRLMSGSPAVDAGNNALVQAALTTDFDGFARISDDPNTVDTGVGTAPIVDMGVYEIQGTAVCLADVNNDGVLNFFDVSKFLSDFAASDPAADFTGDGLFNFFDVSVFLANFSGGCSL